MRLDIILLIIIISLLEGCTNKKPDFKDFIGAWKSENGAEFFLKEDSTCIVQEIDGTCFGYRSNLSFEGKWFFAEKDDNDKTNYNIGIYNIDESGNHSLKISFYIRGKGILENTPPWYLFQYIGDPDDMNKYKFTKQNNLQ